MSDNVLVSHVPMPAYTNTKPSYWTNYDLVLWSASWCKSQISRLCRTSSFCAETFILAIFIAGIFFLVGFTGFAYILLCFCCPRICRRFLQYNEIHPVRKRLCIFGVMTLRSKVCAVLQTVRTPPATFFILQIPMLDENKIPVNSQDFWTQQLGELLLSHRVEHMCVT